VKALGLVHSTSFKLKSLVKAHCIVSFAVVRIWPTEKHFTLHVPHNFLRESRVVSYTDRTIDRCNRLWRLRSQCQKGSTELWYIHIGCLKLVHRRFWQLSCGDDKRACWIECSGNACPKLRAKNRATRCLRPKVHHCHRRRLSCYPFASHIQCTSVRTRHRSRFSQGYVCNLTSSRLVVTKMTIKSLALFYF
jgi:hypothetical protein